RDDAPRALAKLAPRVQATPPEDEQQDEDQERQPIRLLIPDESPEDRLRIDDRRSKRERGIQPDDKAADVDRRKREHAREPPQRRLQRRGRQDVRRDRTGILTRRNAQTAVPPGT